MNETYEITMQRVGKKYRKRPLIVEAFQLGVGCRINTLEGEMVGKAGDWLIKGIAGEYYPCADEVFRATYEEV